MLLFACGFRPRFAGLFHGRSLVCGATLMHQSKTKEVIVKKIASLLTNQNYLACVAAALAFMVTADASHLRDSLNYGLQAVIAAKAE